VNDLSITFIKKIAIYDFGLSLLFIGVSYFFIEFSAFFFLLGILFALINLVLHSIVTNLILLKEGFHKTVITIVSSMFRILLICIPGVLIVSKSNINFLLYILGYTSQMISLVFYGLRLKNS